jgi:hypothetical protein
MMLRIKKHDGEHLAVGTLEERTQRSRDVGGTSKHIFFGLVLTRFADEFKPKLSHGDHHPSVAT